MSSRPSGRPEYQHDLLCVGVALTEVVKLVPNLRDKERYVLHYRNLQLYLNIEPRKKATSGFEKELYKLMNNSVFGKTMENLRKRVDVKLVRKNEEDKLLPTQPLPEPISLTTIWQRSRSTRAVYVGMGVLDLSKHRMYNFYYNQMKAQNREHCQLLYTDTDSLLLEIKTDDVYKDMGNRADHYDMSDYPPEHTLHSVENKKVLGKMKDEARGAQSPNMSACARRCTPSSRPPARTLRRPRASKRPT